MDWLLLIAAVSLLFGFFFIWGDWLVKLKEYLEEPVGSIDDKMLSARNLVGLVLILIGAWVIYEAIVYPQLWLFYVVGLLLLVFAGLYLFSPKTLTKLSAVSDRIVLPIDTIVMRMKKFIGVLLILAAGYLFYAAYLASRIK
ncbi:MAG: hypothetical protein WCW67_05390 [Candidatus Margulisiibacteriota bacterium]|jgi:hypothetical protein